MKAYNIYFETWKIIFIISPEYEFKINIAQTQKTKGAYPLKDWHSSPARFECRMPLAIKIVLLKN